MDRSYCTLRASSDRFFDAYHTCTYVTLYVHCMCHTNISYEVLWPLHSVHKVLGVVIMRVSTLCSLQHMCMTALKHEHIRNYVDVDYNTWVHSHTCTYVYTHVCIFASTAYTVQSHSCTCTYMWQSRVENEHYSGS